MGLQGAPTTGTLFHFSSQTTQVVLKQADGSEEAQTIPLWDLVKTKCPSLLVEFKPAWWLFNGHLQTIYNIAGDFSKVDRILYRRKCINLLDGGTLGLDFAPAEFSRARDDAPIIVVQHGLTGACHEPYLRNVLVPACTPVEDGGLGFRAVVVTFRGCGGVQLTSPKLYTAGGTDDLRQAVNYISTLYPNAPLLGLGFSLGANVMTRYVAEEGVHSQLTSVCVVSCPWDMQENGYGLVRTFLGKNLYARGMGNNMQNLVKRNIAILSKDPRHPIARALPAALALRYPTLPKFDDVFTRKIGGSAPLYPFATVDEYYRWSSSNHVMSDIKIPFLTINSEDDPVVTSVPVDVMGNNNIIMVITRAGGHLGWFHNEGGHAERWITRPILEWLRLMGRDVQRERVANDATLYVDDQGFIRDRRSQWNHLGCRELEGDSLIDGNAGDPGLRMLHASI